MRYSFEWDPEKAAANEAKHGITFAEARSVFLDPLVQRDPDDDHSFYEPRFTAIGMSQLGRLLIVTYTEPGDRIRIISARKPTRREVANYEG
jgi:uncharacterized DUF497 family protein